MTPDPAWLTGMATLANTGLIPVHVGAGSPCTIFVWKIVDAAGRAMQTPLPTVCTQVLQTLKLEVGAEVRHAFEINLADGAYVSDTAYRLHVSYWRHDGMAAFTAP